MGYNNVDVMVSGPNKPSSTYKTKILKGNQSFASQVTEANTKYVIKYDFNLGGAEVTVPVNCILEFDGGSVCNGTLIGQDTVLIYHQELEDAIKDTHLDGTFIYKSGAGIPDDTTIELKDNKLQVKNGGIHGTHLNADVVDDEDIYLTADNKLQFKDRPNTDGMGRVILRKNKTFAEQVTQENTIYEIRYDFDLGGGEVTIPKNCVLKFDGGSLNNGTVICTNTSIVGNKDGDVIFSGSCIDKSLNTLRKDTDNLQEDVNQIKEDLSPNGSVNQKIEATKDEIIDDASEGYNTLKKLEGKILAEQQRASEAENNRYTKSETYNKTELNNMITTPNQKYVSVTATAQTTAVTDVLPATGAADTTYRVGNWDGTQYNDSVFSEYTWNGSAYIKLSTKSQVGEVYDISANHADTKYADLAAALDGSNNIPQSIRKGGMSVKFVQSSDNKYVQYRLMANEWDTNTENWTICNGDVYNNNNEYIAVWADANKKILVAIKSNSDIYFGCGIPSQIAERIAELVSNISDVNDAVNEINNLLSGFESGITLTQYLDNTYGKYVEGQEFVNVNLDSKNRILNGIDSEGNTIVHSLKVINKIDSPDVENLYSLANIDNTIEQTSFTQQLTSITTAESPCKEPDIIPSDAYVINIDSQTDFDSLFVNVNSNISGIMEKGKLLLLFSEGTYYYSEDDTKNNNLTRVAKLINSIENVQLFVRGCSGTKLIAEGEDYSIDDEDAEMLSTMYRCPFNGTFNPYAGFVDHLGNPIDILNIDSANKTSDFEIVDSSSHLTKIAIDKTIYSERTVEECLSANIYIWVTLFTYITDIARIIKIVEEGDKLYAYFEGYRNISSTTNAFYQIIGYNDSSLGKIYVEDSYIYIPYEYKKLHISTATNFLTVHSLNNIQVIDVYGIEFVSNCCSLSKVQLSNLCYLKKDYSSGYYSGIIRVYNYTNNVLQIHGCVFNGINDFCICFNSSDNLFIHNNHFKNTGVECVISNEKSQNVYIRDNVVDGTGKLMQMSFAFSIFSKDFYVRGNEIKNFSYGAIRSGIYFNRVPNKTNNVYYVPTEGIIEDNVCYNEEKYNFTKILRDRGVILVSSYKKDVIIRGNVIYNVSTEERYVVGIYIDCDGCNDRIYGNLVCGDFMRGIWAEPFGTTFNNGFTDASTGNVTLYNITNSNIYVGGNPTMNSTLSVKGRNIILYNGSKPKVQSNWIEEEEDSFVSLRYFKDGSIYVSKDVYDMLMSLPISNNVKNHIRRV